MAKKPAVTEQRTDRVLSRIAAAVGLVVILAALSVVTLEVFRPETPPDLHVREAERRHSGGRVLIEATIENRGDEPVADVEVEARGDAAAVGHVTVDYVAGRSRQGVTFAFDADPGPVSYRVSGWAEP